MPTASKTLGKIALTGATGYVGGRLLPFLLKKGFKVRCLSRRPQVLEGHLPSACEVVKADALDESSLVAALKNCSVAIYLVHSMGGGLQFEEMDRKAAGNFARAAKLAKIKKVIYLGGLGNKDDGLSIHLRSRQEVGEILRKEGPPLVEIRASVVIGAGSLSFDMVRALVERLPIMITPRWVRVPSQPIYINDLLEGLVSSIQSKVPAGIYEVGGKDQVSYGEIMREYARQRGLTRVMLPVPFLTPWLSSLWLGLVTPLYARVGRALVSSLKNSTLVSNPEGMRILGLKPLGLADSMRLALLAEAKEINNSHWTNALSSAGLPVVANQTFGTRIVDKQSVNLKLSAKDAFKPVLEIGGRRGWYFANWLWQLRGWIDLLLGGVGLRRGRPNRALRTGDALDWWRVEQVSETRLRLFAEMRLPGRAWLEFEAVPENAGSRLTQIAVFDPQGLGGLAYWYLLLPVHRWMFKGMLRQLEIRAKKQ